MSDILRTFVFEWFQIGKNDLVQNSNLANSTTARGAFRRLGSRVSKGNWEHPLSALRPIGGLVLLGGEVSSVGDISAQVPFNHHLLSQLVRDGAIRVRNVCPGIPERTLFPSLW